MDPEWLEHTVSAAADAGVSEEELAAATSTLGRLRQAEREAVQQAALTEVELALHPGFFKEVDPTRLERALNAVREAGVEEEALLRPAAVGLPSVSLERVRSTVCARVATIRGEVNDDPPTRRGLRSLDT